jgi:hypothetical protein
MPPPAQRIVDLVRELREAMLEATEGDRVFACIVAVEDLIACYRQIYADQHAFRAAFEPQGGQREVAQ